MDVCENGKNAMQGGRGNKGKKRKKADKFCYFASIEDECNQWLIKRRSGQSEDTGHVRVEYPCFRMLARLSMISDPA